MSDIKVVGARGNNLRDVSVEIPKQRLTVVTGVSGSGKSSLVLGTIAAEALRQLGETFPPFVRNRLARGGRPEVDALENLTAAIVVDQRALGGNARSTVGTASEIAPLLRLLWSRVATPWVGWSPAFSFNDPQGMCPRCEGLGTVHDISTSHLLDRDRSLADGAIRLPTFAPGTVYWKRYVLSGLFDVEKRVRDYTGRERELLLHADGLRLTDPPEGWPTSSAYEGLLPRIRRMYLDRTPSRLTPDTRRALDEIVRSGTCPECGGARLNAAARSATIDGRTIADCAAMEVGELVGVLRRVDDPVGAPMVAAITERLDALVGMGLGYLSLDRPTPTLSGGESQRIRLVRHVGSSLTDLTYVLDEPSAGLHPHDVGRLLELLRRLRDQGNTVLVVEHDPDVVAAADHVVDMGPGSGAAGGRVLFSGPVAGLRAADTPTARALRRHRGLRRPRPGTGTLHVGPVTRHNLHDVEVDLPLGVLTAITGVAGSGKSTLASALAEHPGVEAVDQSPVRGSRRSTVASSTGILDDVRRTFARSSGRPASLFTANGAGGCPECRGLGEIRTDLAFLDDVVTPCEACDATGFTAEARAHRVGGRTIAEELARPVADVDDDRARRLTEIGLGHLALGRSLATLSGGERQRLKLVARSDAGAAILLLDEPTRGLHPTDVDALLGVLDRLVDGGATVVLVEHDLDVVAHADHVVDLGPGAGRDGGRVLHSGPPAALLDAADSLTGEHLARVLG